MESRYGMGNCPLRYARQPRRSTPNGKSLGIKQSGTEKSTSMPAMIRMIGTFTFSKFPDRGKVDAAAEVANDAALSLRLSAAARLQTTAAAAKGPRSAVGAANGRHALAQPRSCELVCGFERSVFAIARIPADGQRIRTHFEGRRGERSEGAFAVHHLASHHRQHRRKVRDTMLRHRQIIRIEDGE